MADFNGKWSVLRDLQPRLQKSLFFGAGAWYHGRL